MTFNYIPQTNSYNCGAVALMNAINYLGETQFKISHIPWVERVLKTTPEFGTEEKHMIKTLRNLFKITIRKTFNKEYFDKWLLDGNQAIILYPWSFETDDWHFSNVFELKNGRYRGANFWWYGESNKWYMAKSMDEQILTKQMSLKDDNIRRVIYLRKRGIID